MRSAAALPSICILAGGLGTRLGELGGSTPKALIDVAGRPFIRRQLELLRRNGAERIVLCVGHLGERIEAALGDGRDLGLSINYSYDPPGLAGTAGAVRGALDRLGDPFMVLYGDTYLRIDYRDFAEHFGRLSFPAQMAVLRNEGRWDTSNLEYDGEMVVRYDKRNPDPTMSWIDYGLAIVRREVFSAGAGAVAADLAEVYEALAGTGQLAGYEAIERFYEIGTPESLAETRQFFASVEAADP